ncbi:hypothetical protein BDF20DRAFT_916489 [Mycotypha africana]|uniref:uncharacterized protein n=1 Tax=Mycotypha africana TaxID=64632 RepID=UPI002300839D|nr:uncharacterized protein BDF20DRAFT_916489 [Mycotypha africana]KAI8969096.1 hypothetical protein BDF20DRAFT_916489 [Mycotypha africana]
MFTSTSPSMTLSPLNEKKRDSLPLLHTDNEDQQSLIETSQLSIRSPSSIFNDVNNNSSTINSHTKRPHYETNWAFDTLCAHPYSPLASIDLQSVFNVTNFQLLSQEKRDELYSLLPEADQNAFFHPHHPCVSPPPPPSAVVSPQHSQHYSQNYIHRHYHESPYHHPYYQYQHPQQACTSTNRIFSPPPHQTTATTGNFFNKAENPVFWDHLTDWQTMLSRGDFAERPNSPLPLSPSPPTTVNHSATHKSSSSTISSSYHSAPTTAANMSFSSSTTDTNHRSPHRKTKSKSSITSPTKKRDSSKVKDELYDDFWASRVASNDSNNTSSRSEREKANNVAGESKCITLKDMCRKGLIRVGDVIVYKRNFSASKVIVSKSMMVIKACGTSGVSIELDGEVYEDFETPTALETKVLDHHGEVTKDKRPNGNAFKSIRLIRSGKDLGRLFDIRKDGFGGNDQ